jgi:hypothetical protein
VSRGARNHHAAAAAAGHAARVSPRRSAPGFPPWVRAARHAARVSARHAPAAGPAAAATGLSAAAGASQETSGGLWSRLRPAASARAALAASLRPRQKAGRIGMHRPLTRAQKLLLGDAPEHNQKVKR